MIHELLRLNRFWHELFFSDCSRQCLVFFPLYEVLLSLFRQIAFYNNLFILDGEAREGCSTGNTTSNVEPGNEVRV